MIRRDLAQERCRKLHVAVASNEGAKRGIGWQVERTRHEAVGLAEHLNPVAALIGERLHPDAVHLVRARRVGVLASQLVGPGNARIAGTESEGALAAVAADHVWQRMRLRTEDR